jgi:DNA-binding response OmpR family regulator
MNDRINGLPPTSQLADSLGKRSVLVVDDEKRIADTLKLILRSKGYAAEAAYDGLSAIEIFREFRPDLIISDVVMPGMNGVEMAIAICNEFSDCRVLLFSGQAVTADILEEARTRGHEFELLAKPVHPDELLHKVRHLIGTSSSGAAM